MPRYHKIVAITAVIIVATAFSYAAIRHNIEIGDQIVDTVTGDRQTTMQAATNLLT